MSLVGQGGVLATSQVAFLGLHSGVDFGVSVVGAGLTASATGGAAAGPPTARPAGAEAGC